ncbi:hypothetical protein [Paenisporosarcina antarctica]|uniref:Uncharacterized protein n=1 Tax=Paenisporosarcina antarctica TaxID=417367 RepID=A0A4P7A2A0_9BACL|nr:hypothetical protein [Paenisporosarcina antarctica]QBP43180.1 hypothetical protein E2636_18670 [Paenisporosarcina antarctica]
MNSLELWLQFKDFFIDLVKYGFPAVALGLSILSYKDSRKANKVQDRLKEVEEKLKKYELEDKEKEREEATKACVEARIGRISKGKYKMKVWNSGKATAYNVNFNIPEECEEVVRRDKVPYEFLESGKSFEEHVLVDFETPNKFKVTTTWMDKQGSPYSKEQIVTI